MYVGIDIGGTKTLVAVLDNKGNITESAKFPTPHEYPKFLEDLATTVATFKVKKFVAGAVGMPVTVFDRTREIGVSFGNLPWKNVPVRKDVEKILGCPMIVNNDAKLAGLSEAMLLKKRYHNVLYVTVSTGIGYAMTNDGIIDNSAGDAGGRALLLEHGGKLMAWESFASGRAIVERYGKKAMNITDKETWGRIAHDLSVGLIELIAVFQPEVIVIGGSVGTYFERYGQLLDDELKKYEIPLVHLPVVMGAQHAEEAVIYGCYDYIKQQEHDGKFAR